MRGHVFDMNGTLLHRTCTSIPSRTFLAERQGIVIEASSALSSRRTSCAGRPELFGEHRRETVEHSVEPEIEAVFEAVGVVRRTRVEHDPGK
jgi:hypothetical protein